MAGKQIVATGVGPARLFGEEGHLVATRGGMLRSISHNVELHYELGDFYTLDSGKTWTLAAPGYARINSIVGARWENPDRVADETGEMRSNPYIKRLPSGAIQSVTVARGLVGRAPNGNLVKMVSTIVYDVEAYFRAELFGKVRLKKPWHDRGESKPPPPTWSEAGRLVARAAIETGVVKPNPEHEVFYHLDENISMIVSLMEPDIHDVLANRGEKQKFAERLASTICERRAMSLHPGFPKSRIPEKWIVTESIREERKANSKFSKIIAAKAIVPVIGWIEPDTPGTIGQRPHEEAHVIEVVSTAEAAEEAMATGDEDAAPLATVENLGVVETIDLLATLDPKIAKEMRESFDLADPVQAGEALTEARHYIAKLRPGEPDPRD